MLRRSYSLLSVYNQFCVWNLKIFIQNFIFQLDIPKCNLWCNQTVKTAQVSLQHLQGTADEVVNHILEKPHRDISLRKIVAMTEGTGGDIYTVGNNLSKSAWAKTHPTDTTTDSLSLAIKRHSSSWVSERDLVGFGFRLGCSFSPEMLSIG